MSMCLVQSYLLGVLPALTVFEGPATGAFASRPDSNGDGDAQLDEAERASADLGSCWSEGETGTTTDRPDEPLPQSTGDCVALIDDG